jgi:predicted nucleotidyltransferase component of viral defense system
MYLAKLATDTLRMLTEKAWNEFKQELEVYQVMLAQAADHIADQDISNYPVFVVYQQEEESGLGLPVVAADAHSGKWSINVTTLEELVAKKVVAMEQVDRFRSLYKTHPADLCYLVWHEEKAQFVFIPRKFAPPKSDDDI